MATARPRYSHWSLAAVLLAATLASAQQPTTAPRSAPQFELVFEPTVSQRPFTGRVYVCLTKRQHLQPVDSVEWIDAERFFARDVKDWQPGEKLIFTSDNSLGYPHELAELPPRTYRAQAVMGVNDWSQDPITAPGNGYSDVAVFNHTGQRPITVRFRIRRTFPPVTPTDQPYLKHVRLKSDLLSRFHQRDVYLQASVALPPIYQDEPERRFPTVYIIPGFGGTTHYSAVANVLVSLLGIEGLDAVAIFLNASCPLGHHVFADSANNGPWGTALVTELIPHLEREFHLIADPDARYLTGHSSGGWSSLWLQITYPETFGGVWSTSPDPVDFTEFMGVNIYKCGQNVFSEPDGSPRCLTRPGIFGKIMARDITHLETVLGRGGQMGSFEAVFSPRGPDGKPAELWDRTTGDLDPAVAEAWRKYDIRHVIESAWATLGPKLRGKLYLYCGDRDDFYLERAFFKLRDMLKKIGSDAYVEVLPGASHMLPPRVFSQIAAQMAAQFERVYKNRQ